MVLVVFPVTQFVELVMVRLVMRVLVWAVLVMMTIAYSRNRRWSAIDCDAHRSCVAGVRCCILGLVGERITTAEATIWRVAEGPIRVERQLTVGWISLLKRC